MPIQQLFEITEEGDGLIIGLVPVINEHPFDVIVKRNGAVGIRELLYIWCRSDLLSPFTDLEESESFKRSKKLAKLPEEWIPDELVKLGVEKYAELQYLTNPELKFLKELRATLSMSGDIINTLRKDMQGQLAEYNVADGVLATDKGRKNKIVTNLLNNIGVIIKLSGDLEKTVATINKLQEKFISDTLNAKDVRGKGELNMFENPEDVGVNIS